MAKYFANFEGARECGFPNAELQKRQRRTGKPERWDRLAGCRKPPKWIDWPSLAVCVTLSCQQSLGRVLEGSVEQKVKQLGKGRNCLYDCQCSKEQENDPLYCAGSPRIGLHANFPKAVLRLEFASGLNRRRSPRRAMALFAGCLTQPE